MGNVVGLLGVQVQANDPINKLRFSWPARSSPLINRSARIRQTAASERCGSLLTSRNALPQFSYNACTLSVQKDNGQKSKLRYFRQEAHSHLSPGKLKDRPPRRPSIPPFDPSVGGESAVGESERAKEREREAEICHFHSSVVSNHGRGSTVSLCRQCNLNTRQLTAD